MNEMSEEPRDFTMAHTHRDGLHTEFAAAEKASMGAESIKKKILRLLTQFPTGFTPDEFVDQDGGLINTVRRRFTDLWKEGKIKHHPYGITRTNDAHNECVVWVLGRDETMALSKFDLLKSENIRLKKIIRIHGINPDLTQIISDLNKTAQENKS